MLGTAETIADVPFDRVRALLTSAGAPTLLGVSGRTTGLTIGVEPEQSMLWVHGGYWYQGEDLFIAQGPHDSDRTQVVYRIRNISGQPDLLIRLWQRSILKGQQHQLEQYAAELAQRL
ncbi:hypothetical protein [Microlunatus soli]|uniref:hypothetical protein n=1 Tax=Microlunatus soli TaxID=630515 RepID=UPI0012FA0B0E|nr:hypothetical protein [Microlunatus soli]